MRTTVEFKLAVEGVTEVLVVLGSQFALEVQEVHLVSIAESDDLWRWAPRRWHAIAIPVSPTAKATHAIVAHALISMRCVAALGE